MVSNDEQSYMRAVADAFNAGDAPRAFRTGTEAVAKGVVNAQLLTLAAYDQLHLKNDLLALDFARRAREELPHSVDTLTVLAIALQRNEARHEAIAIHDMVLRQDPKSVPHRFTKASMLEDMGETSRASREYERVLDADPDHLEALARLANLAVQNGDVAKARDYAQRVKKIDPGNVPATLALATANLQEKKFEDAIRDLGACPPGTSHVNMAIAQGIMGDALDGLGRHADAFTAYGISNTTQRDFYRTIFEVPGVESAYERAERLANYFSKSQKWPQQKTASLSPVKTHLFLVGFPRSGTTLLGQILAAHPDIEVMDERDFLTDAAKTFVVPEDGVEKLSSLTEAELQPWRDRYWREVRSAGAALTKSVFVDKMPLNSVLLLIISKLFPDAKILFALRDPRDVVLSSFRRRFGLSPQMYELTSLDTAARYYDVVMRLTALYREKLPLNGHDVRYEALVRDFEGETKAICKFLDVPWSEAMQEFAKKSKANNINTPSAPQVSRGLYAEGAGQWQHYATQLAPVMPLLNLWVAKFGY